MSIYAKVITFPECDVCHDGTKTQYDTRIPSNGRWANVCQAHFTKFDCKLGLGKGQALVVPFRSLDEEGQKHALQNVRQHLTEEEGSCSMTDAELTEYINTGDRFFFSSGEVCE